MTTDPHPYPADFERVLEFPKIREELHRVCNNEVSRELVERLSFSNHYDTIYDTLETVREMQDLLSTKGEGLPVLHFDDLRQHLAQIRPLDSILSVEGIKALGQLLDVTHQVRLLFFDKQGEPHSPYHPRLIRLAEGLDSLPEIRRSIHNLLDETGAVKDSASKALREIRSKLRHLEGTLSQTMHSILKQAQDAGWVEKDAHPVLRDGRLLLPVIPASKKEVRGIVYEESSTGRTLFMEPDQLVRQNNRIRELQGEEKREVTRLLKAFTTLIRPHASTLRQDALLIGTLDLCVAKCQVACRMGGTVPQLTQERQMEWFGARHPLLDAHLKQQGRELIPLDIHLNQQQRLLVISGPNAGGKSVTLKTVALLQYMLQCGLPIPIADQSLCCIFDRILLDIGDQQSLQDDLSTYSSHLQNMKYFLRNATPHTLLIIDEFGSGTEPVIGGAIAEGVLHELRTTQAFGVITTHYSNLKNYCNEHDGVTNGAMLFDRQKIRPLYKLVIGKAGSSFAIEVARNTGVPERVLAYATNLVGQDFISQDKYLQDILRDKKYWEEKRAEVRKKEKQLEHLKADLEQRISTLKQEKKEILTKAEEQAVQIIKNANASVEKTIRVIQESKANKDHTQRVRQQLQKKKENLQESLEKKSRQARHNLAKAADTPTTSLSVGSNVLIGDSREVGEVLAIEGHSASVRLGSMILRIKTDKLQPTTRQATAIQKSKDKRLEEDHDRHRLTFKPQIDCRGMRVDTALQQVTYFIDDAVRLRYSPVRILHGTGTGALREAIRQLLASTPHVHSFHDEHLDFGGPGITIVELDV